MESSRMRDDRTPHRAARSRRRGVSVGVVVLIVLLALVLGCVGGILLYPRLPFGQPAMLVSGQVTVGDQDLDRTLGTYEQHGRTVSVSVREAIESTMSLDAARNSDGTYTLPSVDTVLALARNRLLVQEAESRGLVATDEDALAYARDMLGTDDTVMIAANYGMEVPQAQEQLRQAATLRKLRDAMVTTAPLPVPAPLPAAPAPEVEHEPTAEYAQYVLSLAGTEWNAAENTWAAEGGPYQERLRDYTISNDAATYAAAQAAYEVANQQYALNQQQLSAEWTAFVNSVLSDVHVELGSLVA